MNSKIRRTTSVTLNPTLEECLYLKLLVQNAEGNYQEEEPEVRKHRMAFWNALPEISELEEGIADDLGTN